WRRRSARGVGPWDAGLGLSRNQQQYIDNYDLYPELVKAHHSTVAPPRRPLPRSRTNVHVTPYRCSRHPVAHGTGSHVHRARALEILRLHAARDRTVLRIAWVALGARLR